MIEVQGSKDLFPRIELAKGETEFSGNKLHELSNPAGEKKAFVVFVIQMGSKPGGSGPLWGQEGGAGSWAFLCPKVEVLLWDLECAFSVPIPESGARGCIPGRTPMCKATRVQSACVPGKECLSAVWVWENLTGPLPDPMSRGQGIPGSRDSQSIFKAASCRLPSWPSGFLTRLFIYHLSRHQGFGVLGKGMLHAAGNTEGQRGHCL